MSDPNVQADVFIQFSDNFGVSLELSVPADSTEESIRDEVISAYAKAYEECSNNVGAGHLYRDPVVDIEIDGVE